MDVEQFAFADGTKKTLADLEVTSLQQATTTGNDSIWGYDGDDTISGSKGNDTIDGGDGTDTLTYAASSAGVNVDLTRSTAQIGGDAAGDMLYNIDNLVGSKLNDTLAGDNGDNVLTGGGGSDSLIGNGGYDRYQLSSADKITTITNGIASNANPNGRTGCKCDPRPSLVREIGE